MLLIFSSPAPVTCDFLSIIHPLFVGRGAPILCINRGLWTLQHIIVVISHELQAAAGCHVLLLFLHRDQTDNCKILVTFKWGDKREESVGSNCTFCKKADLLSPSEMQIKWHKSKWLFSYLKGVLRNPARRWSSGASCWSVQTIYSRRGRVLQLGRFIVGLLCMNSNVQWLWLKS